MQKTIFITSSRYFLPGFIFLVFLTTQSAQAVVRHIAHLKQKKTGRQVVLVGDIHFSNERNQEETELLTQLLKKHQGTLITEVPENFSPETVPGCEELLLYMLNQKCLEEGITVKSSEYPLRAALRTETLIVDGKLREKNSELDLAQAATDFYGLFANASQQGWMLFSQELVPYVPKASSGIKEGIDSILISYDRNRIHNNLVLDKIDVEKFPAGAFLQMAFLMQEGKLNDPFIYQAIDELDRLFDANLLKKIDESQNKTLLVVHAGAQHIDNVLPVLLSAGFELIKEESAEESNFDKITEEIVKEMTKGDNPIMPDFQEILSSLAKRIVPGKHFVDIKKFLNSTNL
jgi:hypothetical protein